MSRIAFIAPDKYLFLKGKTIIQELGLENEVVMYLARLKRAIKLVKKLQYENIDVIVSRGGTAAIIEAEVRVPVVQIAITGQDLALAFQKAKHVTGLPNPKVALLAFSNMIYDIEALAEALGIQLQIYRMSKIEDISAMIEAVAVSDADIMVGGVKAVSLALKKGLKAQFINSGDYSLRAAFLEAKKISLARKIEKEQAQEFKALIDYSLEGIISINCEKTIKIFNPAAERLLNLSSHEILGQKIDAIINFINVDDCLLAGQKSIGQIIQRNNIWLSLNISPIVVEQTVIGAMITFQDITIIQEMEEKIRKDILTKNFVAEYQFADILGSSKEIVEAKRIAQEMAAFDATVLITGESGTGKELFAQSIHNKSERKKGPFVAINCAALPSNLVESELFGYVEGAFTGAQKKGKRGLFEMAHRGTIFLDEISEMDKYAQSRLLRVLQEKQVMRLGDDKYIPVDVRVIAATNKNLKEQVKEGHFREDLFYRLKVLTITLPPLRRRSGDVAHLTHRFLEYYDAKHLKRLEITPDACNYLSEYTWPGNVRELMYFVERLVIVAKEKIITDEVIRKYWEEDEYESGDVNFTINAPRLPEEKMITYALERSNSNISHAAKLLGMDRSTLYRKLKTYKIEFRKKY